MSGADREPPRIADHAIIGDCRSAALLTRDGAIDWLCWPRFDSPALFAGLLDARRGGTWSLCPTDPHPRVTRRYRSETAVLETRFETDGGVLLLTDFMPVASEPETRGELWPEHQLLRRLACVEGAVEAETRFAPAPDFGRRAGRTRRRGAAGVIVELGDSVLAWRSELPHTLADGEVHGRARLAAGDVRWSSLTFASRGPAHIAPLGAVAERRLEQTLAWWRAWARGVTYRGPHRGAVLRSAITLKLLAYPPSGAVVAAPTTSLPEHVGGERNWDYRYCWLRDAAMTVRAFYALGLSEEGEAFASWLLHATRLTWPEVHVLYDVYGNPPPEERTLDHLAGFRDSRPVRVGNGARDQLQLDVYGEVVGAVAEYARRGGRPDRAARRFLRGIAETVCRRWAEPDHGIWEVRGPRRSHTYSRVRCWCALDELLELDRAWELRLPRERVGVERDRIRAAAEAEGWREELGSYVAASGEDDVDASLLLLAEHGYADGDGRERFAGTVARIERELARGPLVYRYRQPDGLEGREGAFGICSFWRVLALTQIGAHERAARLFGALLRHANDVGLYGEQIDPDTGEALGNFPQAFTHVGLIRAALALGAPATEEAA